MSLTFLWRCQFTNLRVRTLPLQFQSSYLRGSLTNFSTQTSLLRSTPCIACQGVFLLNMKKMCFNFKEKPIIKLSKLVLQVYVKIICVFLISVESEPPTHTYTYKIGMQKK